MPVWGAKTKVRTSERVHEGQTDEDMRRRRDNTTARGCNEGDPTAQGQPMNLSTRLGRFEAWIKCRCGACTLRAGPMCAQKKNDSEMTGHEGRQDMKRKRKGSVCEGNQPEGPERRSQASLKRT